MTSENSTSILKGATRRDARWTLARRNWGGYAAAAYVRLKAVAPYALMELVLPGGSVMALLLWFYRRRKNGVGFGQLPVRLLSFLRLADPLSSNTAVCVGRSAVGPMTAASLEIHRASARMCERRDRTKNSTGDFYFLLPMRLVERSVREVVEGEGPYISRQIVAMSSRRCASVSGSTSCRVTLSGCASAF